MYHFTGISCVQFDDTRIVSGSSDKTIKVNLSICTLPMWGMEYSRINWLHNNWCPGSLWCQTISCHDIDCVYLWCYCFSYRESYFGSMSHFTDSFLITIHSNSMVISVYSSNSNEVIAKKFCRCHDNIAVLVHVCAEFWCDLMTRNWITAKRNFHCNWILSEKLLAK